MVFTSSNTYVLIYLEYVFDLVKVSFLDTIKTKSNWNKNHHRILLFNYLFNLIHKNAGIKTNVYFKPQYRLEIVINVSENDRYHLRAVPLSWFDLMHLTFLSNRVNSKRTEVHHRSFRTIIHKHSQKPEVFKAYLFVLQHFKLKIIT